MTLHFIIIIFKVKLQHQFFKKSLYTLKFYLDYNSTDDENQAGIKRNQNERKNLEFQIKTWYDLGNPICKLLIFPPVCNGTRFSAPLPEIKGSKIKSISIYSNWFLNFCQQNCNGSIKNLCFNSKKCPNVVIQWQISKFLSH